ncbi:hypothetical protein ALQ60_101024 [Pseudomonas syringae pv. papulans]|nr:hypothetical protein ALQ60_101024 [Pseudomonas syringae pv. papulans]
MRSSFLTLQRGNAGPDALRRKEDAERPELHDDAERRHDSRHRLRERVRSYGLRPESKADLCIMMSALRHIPLAFCVLFKATINKIRNIGVQPRAMHTAIACGQQSAVFKGSSLQIAHPMIPLQRLEAAWVWITFRPHKNTWPDNGLHDFMDFSTLPWRFTAPT